MYQQKTLKQSLIENYKNTKQEEKINTFKGRQYSLPPNIIALYDENHKLHWHRPKSPNYEILSCSNDLSVKKWNLKNETCENTIYLSHLGFVKVLLMTFCDELITGSLDRNNNLKVWDLNGAYIRTLVGHTDGVLSLIMLPNGNLMSGSRDSTIKTWDYHKGVVLKSIKIESYWIHCFIKSPITGEIISSSFDNHGKVKLWNSKSGRLINELIGHSNYTCCLIIIPSGGFTGYFVTGSFDKTIKLWTRLGKCIKTLRGHTDWVSEFLIGSTILGVILF
jgi:WD40 repeat protein